jgi:cyanate lyase
MIIDRNEVTNMIRAAKVEKNIKWAAVAAAIRQSKEWTTAGCLGQMAFTKAQAEAIGARTFRRGGRLAPDRALSKGLCHPRFQPIL